MGKNTIASDYSDPGMLDHSSQSIINHCTNLQKRERIFFYFFLVVSATSACKGQDLGVSCTTVDSGKCYDFIGEHFFSIVPRLFSSKIS